MGSVMCSKKHNPKRNLLLILTFFIFNSSLLIATVRYVSHSGSNTPPYTSWATAADSIMSAINISVFGDTIYVANGVYEEQVIMISGLSLIGAGLDSCIIDTRIFIGQVKSIRVGSYCSVQGFKIRCSNGYNSIGSAIYISWGENSIKIMDNKVEFASIGIEYHYIKNCEIKRNIFTYVDWGIYCSYDPPNPPPPFDEITISHNQINAYEECISYYSPTGIRILINNNSLFANERFARGIDIGGYSIYPTGIYNNLSIITSTSGIGISSYTNNIRLIYNNLVTGYPNTGISTRESQVINNSVLNSFRGIRKHPGTFTILLQYNHSWNNEINYYNVVPDSTNISVDPMFINEDSLDFHLQMFSPLIDAGDPNVLDIDGSRSDIGLFGGPYGEIYTYRDLAPKPPSNLTAVYDSGLVKLTWNKNTEADFYYYRVYRDTVPNFMYDTTKIIAVLADTFYYDSVPEKFLAGDYYYKITALDSVGHQSAPSEEVHVIVTGIPEAPPMVVEHYQLLNNYPNPFNSSTVIPYRLKEAGYVKLYIYDIKGELVRILINEYQSAGYYEARFSPTREERKNGEFSEGWWTGYNDDIATGIYIYQLLIRGEGNIPVFTDMGKMILLK
jgi:hypothetical protein